MTLKMKKLGWALIALFSLSTLAGCRAWAPPPSVDHNPQPWAQQESWEGQLGVPGFSGTGGGTSY